MVRQIYKLEMKTESSVTDLNRITVKILQSKHLTTLEEKNVMIEFRI